MTVYALNGLGRIGKLALKPLLEPGAGMAWINDAVCAEFPDPHDDGRCDCDHTDLSGSHGAVEWPCCAGATAQCVVDRLCVWVEREATTVEANALSTMVINDTQVKVYAWFDKEMGYAHRFVDVVLMVVGRL